MLKLGVDCKNRLEVQMNSSYPSNIVLLVWMKTQPIMTTMTPFKKSAINDFVMESSFLEFHNKTILY
jgi:hypothetical protein